MAGDIGIFHWTTWRGPKNQLDVGVHNSTFRGYNSNLPICKAVFFRGPITPFMTIIGAHLERRRKSIKGYDGLVWGLFTSIFGFLSVVRLRRGRYLTTREDRTRLLLNIDVFFSRYIALLVTLFHCCWNLMIFGAFLSFGGLRKRWVSDMWNHRTDKLSLFSHGSSSAHPQEEMKKELILGGHHHVFFPSNHGGFMNELVWVCGEHANVVDFFLCWDPSVEGPAICNLGANLRLKSSGGSFVLFNGENKISNLQVSLGSMAVRMGPH